MNLFKPNEQTENYHIRKPKDKKSLFEIEDKNYIYVGQSLFSSETSDKLVESSSKRKM